MCRNEMIEAHLVQFRTMWFNISRRDLPFASQKLADNRAIACARKHVRSKGEWEYKLAAILKRMNVMGAGFGKVETGWVGRDVVEVMRERRDADLISPWR
jgi:hypothetical protein